MTPNPNPSPELLRKIIRDMLAGKQGARDAGRAILAAPKCPACDGTKVVSQGGHDTGCNACYVSPQTLPAPGEVEAGARNLYLLQGDNARMAEALRQCRDQFAFYAREHYAAGKSEKGDTNTRFADVANKALTAVKPATVAAANDEAFARGVEAAAKVADSWKSPLRPGTDARLLGHQEAARSIAAAIRLLSQGRGK